MTQSDSEVNPQQPHHFCTYFDRNYLTRGLALYHSLRQHCRRPFVLWTLCFDDESYAILNFLNLNELRLIHRADFEAGDGELAVARENRTAVEYYWTCTPSLPLYVLGQDKAIEVITYLDADLFFFSNPQPIFDELGLGSILIHEHRYSQENMNYRRISGIYNVGLLCFRRDIAGLACLNWWRERCNEWCYARYQDGKYGDQLYLNDWPARFDGVVVLQNAGAGLAPWNLTQYHLEYSSDNFSVDDGPLIFFHFHGLKVFSERIFAPGGNYTFPIVAITHIYKPYLMALRRAAHETSQTFADNFVSCSWRMCLHGLFYQEYCLDRWELITRQIWMVGGWNRRARKYLELSLQLAQDGLHNESRKQIFAALAASPLIVLTRSFLKAIGWFVLGKQGVAVIKKLFKR